MRRRTAVIVSVALTLAVVSLYIVPMFLFRYLSSQTQQPPLEQQVSYIRLEEGGRRAVIERPLSWSEVTELFMKGMAHYSVLMYYREMDLVTMYMIYVNSMVNSTDPCEAVKTYYSFDEYSYYAPIFDDNCFFLRKMFFSTEREWFPTLALVPTLAEEYAKRNGYEKYSVWAIVYFENGSMVAEFYNVVNQSEKEAFVTKYEQLVKSYNKLVAFQNSETGGFWYWDFKAVEESGTPFILVFEADRNVYGVEPPLQEDFEKYGLRYEGSFIVAYRNGDIVAVYSVSKTFCGDAPRVPCVDAVSDLLGILSQL